MDTKYYFSVGEVRDDQAKHSYRHGSWCVNETQRSSEFTSLHALGRHSRFRTCDVFSCLAEDIVTRV